MSELEKLEALENIIQMPDTEKDIVIAFAAGYMAGKEKKEG